MTTQDIMIGDWVFFPEIDQYVVITSICDEGMITVTDQVTSRLENHPMTPSLANRYMRKCDKFEAIPLTKEILEMNGFSENGEGVWGDNNSFFIPTYQSGFDTGATWETHIEPSEGIGNFSGKLRFVHQLQHVLKVCGIYKPIKLW